MDLEQIKSEITRLRTSISGLQEKLANVQRDISTAEKELEHWIGILSIRDGGITKLTPLPQNKTQPLFDVRDEQNEGYGAKSHVLRNLIRQRGDIGVSIAELVLECKKLNSRPNTAYRFIERLTNSKPPELRREGNRVYPTEALKED